MKKNIYVVIIAVIFSALLWGSISLSNTYISTIEMPVRITGFPDGYATPTRMPDKIAIKVRGQGWKLVYLSLNTDVEYRISSGRNIGRKFVNLYNYILENQWLTSDVDVVSIYPDTLSYYVERIGEKTVKVVPDTRFEFKNGYGLAGEIQVDPDSVVIKAPISLLAELSQVYTEEIELNNLDSRMRLQTSLKDIPNVSFTDKTVFLNLDVQKIIEKTIENIPVQVRDIPVDRDVTLLPGKIIAGLKGGINVVAKIAPEDLEVYIYYRDVVLDTLGSISPIIHTPQNTQLVFVKPERLRYIIKKFR